MEFGLHESLPIYAGGLGLLAGDHVKSSSDLAVPLVGIGLFYREGYFRQLVDARGRQEVVYPRARFDDLPLQPVPSPSGKGDLHLEVELPEGAVVLRVFSVQVGRVPVYLLDAEVPANRPRHRRITRRLYGGTREDRIRQELVLGVGGVRLLRALGIRPAVWHLNEGHVVFLTIERLRELRRVEGLSAREAQEVVAADTVFTTHTPVPEGNEVFDLALADRYLRRHAEAAGVPLEEYLELGLDRDSAGRRVLSLTVLAMRLSRFRNAVSALHGEVARRMWSRLWPGFRADEAPITSVTNGIHTPSWVAPEFDALYRERLGEDWVERLADVAFWKAARKIPDRALWETKQELRGQLVAFVRQRAARRLRRQGRSAAAARRESEGLLRADALTIGFARRFALYKRAALIFRDVARIARLLGSRRRPVQIVFAGKPHPEDPAGKRLFEKVVAFSRRAEFRGRIVVLEDYDIEVARHLVRGADVWLNSPRRPLEASGTSGQKVLINGGLNLSVLDGWWSEGAAGDTGFTFGRATEHGDPDVRDRQDAESLLRVLERDVVPLYFRRSRQGLPTDWLRLVKSSVARLVPLFSTHTMVRAYARELYLPAAENGRYVRSSRFALARELAAWREKVERCWPLVEVFSVRSEPRARTGRRRTGRIVDVELYLGGLFPEDIACCGEDGQLVPLLSAAATGDGVHRLRLEVPQKGGYRLFPVHPEQVHLQELGLATPFEVG